MDYTLKRSKRKTLCITISNGAVSVKAPLKTSVARIEEFIAEKSDWIAKKLNEQAQKSAALAPVTSGASALYHGTVLPIVPTVCTKACINGSVLYLPVKYDDQAKRDRAIANMYKRMALAELSDRLFRLSAATGLKYKSFALTNARTQWGNCDSNCNIRLNWRLIMLDDELCNYVIIHELCHTEHHNHSAAFWAKVKSYMPNYAAAKKRLKTFSALTSLYR